MAPTIPLKHSSLNLDISGVAGFFGGDVAVSAMATVHVYPGRKWLGWYNTPGSYEIAKRYGQLGRTRFWDGLYPGVNVEPAVLFELDGMTGPKYRALQSGTVMRKTSHIAHLFAQECKDIEAEEWVDPNDKETRYRKTSPIDVTIADLKHTPELEERPRMTDNQTITATSLLALIPILSSGVTAVACAVYQDWYCFSMIVLGMLVGGFSCFVIGNAKFIFSHPRPAQGAPPAHGILDDGEQIVVLKGPEGAVNPITRGGFSLKYTGEPNFHMIGASSFFLTVQFLAQLLVVPQGEIFGQIMFISSLAISWMYNSYLSSLDKESIQRRILINKVLYKPDMHKFELGTRTTMVVFVLLVLATPDGHGAPTVEEGPLRSMLNDLLPNDTDVWRTWKENILSDILNHFRHNGSLEFDYKAEAGTLLDDLYQDAQAAAAAYEKYRE